MNKVAKEDVAQFFHGGLVFERRFRERGANATKENFADGGNILTNYAAPSRPFAK